jgi:DNA adenine methylase Dam
MGNKKKIIQNGLVDLFPKNIETFYDVFCGSCTVTMNADAIYFEVNDLNAAITDLIQWFCYFKPEEIIEKLEKQIDKYQLPTFSTDTRKYKGDREIYKVRYNKLRDDYNTTRDSELLYLLNIFSNSHMIRFNSNGDFNMPFGNGYLTEDIKTTLLNHNLEKITYISNYDFRHYENVDFQKEDFVYLDPPYFTSDATYNENNGWTEKDENDLHSLCNLLNDRGVKFGISNIIENTSLMNWANENSYKVHIFDELHCACGNGNKKRREVYICNY